MLSKPNVKEIIPKVGNRYQSVLAIAKRARKLAEGEKCLSNVKERSTVTLAANEIAEGKVKIVC